MGSHELTTFTAIQEASTSPPYILEPRVLDFDLPADEITELTLLSTGYSIKGSAELQGISDDAVNKLRMAAKEHLGARNRRQMITLAIQSRSIDIDIEANPSFKALSKDQDAVLRLFALGWTSPEIQARYGISEMAVDSRLVQAEKKLAARSLHHAIRRAFELGIFKIDERILDPDEIKDAGDLLKIVVGGTALSANEIGLSSENEQAIVRILGRLGIGYFNGGIMSRNGFSPNSPSEHTRSNVYRVAAAKVERKLNDAFGEIVLTSHALSRNYRYYYVAKEMAIVTPESLQTIMPVDVAKLPKPSGNVKKMKVVKPVKAKPKPHQPIKTIETTLRQMEQATVDIIESFQHIAENPYLDQDSLPDLNEALLKNLVPRPKTELSDHQGVLPALKKIMQSKQAPFDYRDRLVASLRFGVPVTQPVVVSRREQKMPLQEIMEYVPSDQGLDAASVSLITSLRPAAVLETELAFLQKHKEQFPRLAPLIKIVAQELIDLRKQTA